MTKEEVKEIVKEMFLTGELFIQFNLDNSYETSNTYINGTITVWDSQKREILSQDYTSVPIN